MISVGFSFLWCMLEMKMKGKRVTADFSGNNVCSYGSISYMLTACFISHSHDCMDSCTAIDLSSIGNLVKVNMTW